MFPQRKALTIENFQLMHFTGKRFFSVLVDYHTIEKCIHSLKKIDVDFLNFYYRVRLEALKRLCDVMSGDILELKAAAIMASSSFPTKHCHEEEGRGQEAKFEIDDETQFSNNHISVSDVLQRPSFRQASASTFLCPDNIPGKNGVKKPQRQSYICKQSLSR